MKTVNGPYAILSVTDKTGLLPFAKSLHELGYQLLSTGGTAQLLRDAGVPVTEVADFTQSTEFFGGRVKTLHPRIHGGILMDRNSTQHQSEAVEQRIEAIDLVVVNLYQFAEQAVAQKLSIDKAIEYIDIGGPTMLRAAAKNHKYCLPIIDPQDYSNVIQELQLGGVKPQTRQRLAAKVFQATAEYDRLITQYLSAEIHAETPEETSATPDQLSLSFTKQESLRYGENPQQSAAFYSAAGLDSGLQDAKILQGKALSYNNYLDLDAASQLVAEFAKPAVAIIKHTNPCGVAAGKDSDALVDIYERALNADAKSAFGGIVATNRPIDGATAIKMAEIFLECIAAPEFTAEAMEVFARKKNLRLLTLPYLALEQAKRCSKDLQFKSVRGGLLVQTSDELQDSPEQWKLVGSQASDAQTLDDLWFAWIVAKHVKSNAIVFAKDQTSMAIGAGQMSRVDAVNIAIQKAQEYGHSLSGTVLASDAFFPFRDNVDQAAKHGIKAIVQPGGSIRDDESIAACDEHGIVMYFTDRRHFRH
ncbi:MAG: bifunctional phosphoribosylaminoimidazolecarboxamide formyltransferase/IMP cyclohydrolase [Oligoflexus sp.]